MLKFISKTILTRCLRSVLNPFVEQNVLGPIHKLKLLFYHHSSPVRAQGQPYLTALDGRAQSLNYWPGATVVKGMPT